METRLLTAKEVTKLQPGSLVIAVFTTDSKRYRAKIEKIVTNNDGKRSFKVRYIDYGNSSEVEVSQLYTWEPLLEAVPAQAICCKLNDLKVFVEPILPGTKMAEHFANSMKHFSPLKMKVKEILRSREDILKGKRISSELVVNLECHSSAENILKKLTVFPVLNGIMNVENISTSGGQSLNNLVLSKDRLDIIGEGQAVPGVSVPPPPDHLKHCPLSCDTLSEFSLPAHPAVAFSVDKVSKWLPCLDRDIEDVSADQVKIEEDKSVKKKKKPLPKEPEFSKSAATRRKLISDAKKDCGSGESEKAIPATKEKSHTESTMMRKKDDHLFPSQDIRKFKEVASCSVPELSYYKDDLIREAFTEVSNVRENPTEINQKVEIGSEITNDNRPPPKWSFQEIEVSFNIAMSSLYN